MQQRLESAVGTEYEVPEEDWAGWIRESLQDGDGHELSPGWPKLVLRGSDADTLTLPLSAHGAR